MSHADIDYALGVLLIIGAYIDAHDQAVIALLAVSSVIVLAAITRSFTRRPGRPRKPHTRRPARDHDRPTTQTDNSIHKETDTHV